MTPQSDDCAVLVEDLEARRLVVAKPDEQASAIITDSIAPERRDEYLRWVRGINRAAESFAGYRETNVFPPLGPEGREWITIIHFQTRPDLENWLGSAIRAEWVDRFRRDFGDFALHRVQGGLTSWFGQQRLPGWKMGLTVLLALYPTVMLISLVVMPWLSALPFALSMFLGNVLSVSLLQWVLMPRCNRMLSFWLKPAAVIDGRSNVVGTAVVLGAILAILVLFLTLGRHV